MHVSGPEKATGELHISIISSEVPLRNTVFPHLLNTPLIEYSNILNTEVVHGLGSLPKIIKFKGCIQFELIEYQNKWTFFPIMH